jgi:predicted acetyltransferase
MTIARMEENMIKLIRPTLDLKEKAIDYKQEHFDKGERIINGSELWDKIENYEDWLEMITKNANPATVSKDWVVTDTFFAIREEDMQIIGIIDFRHTLNAFLENFGNCGYSVRPSERKKGYATEMLRQLLQIAKESGLDCIHLAVERSNEPSIRTIKKNKAVLERSFKYEGELADIYVIYLY